MTRVAASLLPALFLWAGKTDAQSLTPFDYLLSDEVTTHIAEPGERLDVYALIGGFSKKLDMACPGLLPQDYEVHRTLMEMAFIGIVARQVDRELLEKTRERLASGLNPIENPGRIERIHRDTVTAEDGLKQIGIITARLRAYQEVYGSDIAVETLIKDFGGCESPLMRTFAERLTHFTARGTIRTAVEPGTRTLSREVRSEDGNRLVCFYKTASEENEIYQFSDASSVENFLRSSPSGVFFETFLKNNQSNIESNQSRLLATLRSSCPYTPDPDLESKFSEKITKLDVSELKDASDREFPERMADFFFDTFIPQFPVHRTPLTASQEEIDAVKRAIVMMESIQLTEEDVRRDYDKWRRADIENCLERGDSTDHCERISVHFDTWETRMRSRLFSQSVSVDDNPFHISDINKNEGSYFDLLRKGIPSYSGARDYILRELKRAQ